MPAHTNEKLYNEAISNVEQGDYTEYDRVREIYLTPKYDFEDYGYTLTILSIPIFIIGIVGLNRFKTPSNRIDVLTIGLLAALTRVEIFIRYGQNRLVLLWEFLYSLLYHLFGLLQITQVHERIMQIQYSSTHSDLII